MQAWLPEAAQSKPKSIRLTRQSLPVRDLIIILSYLTATYYERLGRPGFTTDTDTAQIEATVDVTTNLNGNVI